MPFVLAFEFGATFCAENAGTTKLCKEKCLSQTLVAPKTKAPFVGTTKFHGKTKTTTTSIPTTTERQKFAFEPFAEFVSHFGTNCSKIVFPVEVAKFILNITAVPYLIACNDYEQDYEIGQSVEAYVANANQSFFNACMEVPTTKCAKHVELSACYKSMKTVVPKDNAIAKLCQDHVGEANVAGFSVQICIHRDQKEQKLVFETFLNLSTTDKFIKMTRSFPISIEQIMETKETIPVFFLEFGIDLQHSAIREKANGKVISGALNKNANGIGTVLNDIKAEKFNENLAKMIHLVPPFADQMLAFFQIPTPQFNKLISAQTNLKPYENDPKKEGQASMCDEYGKDCEVIKKLLHKIDELRNCKNETIDTSAFDLPKWVDVPPPAIPYQNATETLICYGDMYCNKEMLQEDYDQERIRCGLEPENLINRRKRQFRPFFGPQFGKWNSFPIVISYAAKKLPKDYRAWKAAIKVGANMIMQHTCVQFKIVNVKEKDNYSEGILIRDIESAKTLKARNVCLFGQTMAGKVGGWQELQLSMEHTCLILHPNMSGVACHELLHALGNVHEQSRSDARNFVILRRQNSQSRIRHDAENFGFGYDFGSVLHYGGHYDEENDEYDLITLPRFYQQTIGQMERISFKDAAIINEIYCKDSCKGHEDKCQNGGYLNPNDCTKCHCPDGYGGQYCAALEENENCNILSDESRELKSDQTAKVLKPVIGCTSAGKECRCHWRITPMSGKKVQIQFKSLNNSLICSHPCTPPYVEIKYRADKRAQGAKLCCPRALTDLNANEYKNWIEAEKPDMDIVISAHLSPKWTVPSTVFELTYESGNVKLIYSSKCVKAENLYAEKRNPGTGTLMCYYPAFDQLTPCSCNGDKKCLAEEKWTEDTFICPILKVNGIQINGSRQTMHTDPKHYHYNSTQIDVDCYKAEGGTVSFWGYSKPETKEIIRVDEIHCLTNEAAGVPERFKSLQVEEQPPMKLSPTSPFLANNASSLIHVFVPFVGHP
ncbi:hypothetical protein niasHS_016168 [Heterodera schachtii]|uniref:Metalloendopeptidase n=1 Tax=Heterodera schachtii TaxID=97005 RepID=A0ABD2HTZ7_HETSC